MENLKVEITDVMNEVFSLLGECSRDGLICYGYIHPESGEDVLEAAESMAKMGWILLGEPEEDEENARYAELTDAGHWVICAAKGCLDEYAELMAQKYRC